MANTSKRIYLRAAIECREGAVGEERDIVRPRIALTEVKPARVFWIVRRPARSQSSKTTSKARMRSPTNVPSMRGREKLLSMMPSKVPYPPIGTALVGEASSEPIDQPDRLIGRAQQ